MTKINTPLIDSMLIEPSHSILTLYTVQADMRANQFHVQRGKSAKIRNIDQFYGWNEALLSHK